MLDASGDPMDQITVIDLQPGGTDRVFDLTAPGTDGYSVQTVVYADAMDFTSDNRYVIYDAFNILELSDGSQIGAWSIYAIDLVTEQTFAIIQPTPGYDISYPSLSQTTAHLMTWDQYNISSEVFTTVAGNLISGEAAAVGTVNGDYGVPGYNGDDSAIAYGQVDAAQPTGYSMDLQPLAADKLTPVGNPSRDLVDAEFGVIYRRGSFTAPVPGIMVSPASVNFSSTYLNAVNSQTITINNDGGAANLMIENISVTGTHETMFALKSGCIGQRLTAGGTCLINVDFMPTSLGDKTAMLTISSDDPDTPSVEVPLTGKGISEDPDDATDAGGLEDPDVPTDTGGSEDSNVPTDTGGGGGGGCFLRPLFE